MTYPPFPSWRKQKIESYFSCRQPSILVQSANPLCPSSPKHGEGSTWWAFLGGAVRLYTDKLTQCQILAASQPLPPMRFLVGKAMCNLNLPSFRFPRHTKICDRARCCLSRRCDVVGAFWAFSALFSPGTFGPASISRSRCPREKSISVSFRTRVGASCPPRPAEGAYQPSRGYRNAGWHAKEGEARVLCQEKPTPFRKLRGLEPKLGEKGWIEACRASSAATNAPFELLFSLLLQPQLAGQLSCRCQTHRCINRLSSVKYAHGPPTHETPIGDE